ncbi:DUF5961 family protein [Methylobacterium gnaphalii]|uniref:Uncharacterized protein n=1 Tax=Methylobacterium gnaphalii TaxID=1010610 RepID=A0A512JQT5_9HYPH|nr:DUF5961 family protein [Methylobacterium gnaphalii]GEP12309.1 hypothetical protein MGN01_41540 [Methylobacterium gnaphalii]GJD70909.1 hypothetical protein MMMDOFMJ_3863 [Methylobacterium gnaphalii]GLS50908.1 hypothetical protein GCM10007885_37620 [Methylobacterium gnaphalii]
MNDVDLDRLFRVRGRHEDPHLGRLVRETSSEAAAIAYVEHLAFAEGQNQVGVVVRDMQTGHEHSYLIHLDTGDLPAVG